METDQSTKKTAVSKRSILAILIGPGFIGLLLFGVFIGGCALSSECRYTLISRNNNKEVIDAATKYLDSLVDKNYEELWDILDKPSQKISKDKESFLYFWQKLSEYKTDMIIDYTSYNLDIKNVKSEKGWTSYQGTIYKEAYILTAEMKQASGNPITTTIYVVNEDGKWKISAQITQELYDSLLQEIKFMSDPNNEEIIKHKMKEARDSQRKMTISSVSMAIEACYTQNLGNYAKCDSMQELIDQGLLSKTIDNVKFCMQSDQIVIYTELEITTKGNYYTYFSGTGKEEQTNKLPCETN